MEARRVVSGRNWMITVQAPAGSGGDWKLKFPGRWEGAYTFKAQVYELGENAKTVHTHLLIRFKNSRRSNRLAAEIIKENKGSEVDVELKLGSWKDALAYITKQDQTKIANRPPVISGDMPREYKSSDEKRREEENKGIRLREIAREGGGANGDCGRRPDIHPEIPEWLQVNERSDSGEKQEKNN